MPRQGRSFTAKGGTVFSWYTDGSSQDIEVILPANRIEIGTKRNIGFATIPHADLDEFVAHIIADAAEETLGRVLLFPCLGRASSKARTRPADETLPPDPKDAA
jgi:hypothetical protein